MGTEQPLPNELIIAELVRIHERLDAMDSKFDQKLQGVADVNRDEQKCLTQILTNHEREIAVLKNEMAIKTAMVAAIVSCVITVTIALIT